MSESDLTGLNSAQLVERLKHEMTTLGGLVLDGEKDLARELVRRARREEHLRALLTELLAAGNALARDPGAASEWHAAAARAAKTLNG